MLRDYSSLCAQGFTPGSAKKPLVEIKAEMDTYKASVLIDYLAHEVLFGRVPFFFHWPSTLPVTEGPSKLLTEALFRLRWDTDKSAGCIYKAVHYIHD